MRSSAKCIFAFAVIGASVFAACRNEKSDPAKAGDKPPSSTAAQCGGGVSTGPSPLRRLTNHEYDNTIRDLLGDTTAPATTFAEAGQALGFDNNADILNVNELLAEQYMVAAEGIAERATADLPKLLGCDGSPSCIREFVTKFGARAWRRPLEKAEIDALVALSESREEPRERASVVLQALLESPSFLYRVELAGAPAKPEDAFIPLTDWEMASRLSYLLWASMPDDELFAAATAGKLRTREEVLAQAQRMISSPRARDMVANFHKQWLLLGEIDNLDKNVEVYPEYRPELRPLWRRETEEFVSRTVLDEGGSLAALLTANHTFVNKTLADFYGVAGATTDEAWVKVNLDPARTAGFLTHAGHLASLSKPNQSSPVHRGKFIREQLLCQQLPPPPPNIDITPPDLDPKLTTRQRFAQHSTDPMCKGCHHLMDPVGLGFEHYDGVGKWREQENGLPIDDTGKVEEADLGEPEFKGAVALAKQLASSNQVRDCVATQWFRYSYGRAETAADACSLTTLKDKFRASGGNVKQLILDLTQTDAFMFRSGGKP